MLWQERGGGLGSHREHRADLLQDFSDMTHEPLHTER